MKDSEVVTVNGRDIIVNPQLAFPLRRLRQSLRQVGQRAVLSLRE